MIGTIALVAGVGALVGGTVGPGGTEDRAERRERDLRPTTHTVVYEVKGTGTGGKSPQIAFRTNGVNTDQRVENAPLPWRKKVTITAGPGAAVAQVMAAGGDADSVTCSVRVDGDVVDSRTSKGRFSNVSCSGVIQPGAK